MMTTAGEAVRADAERGGGEGAGVRSRGRCKREPGRVSTVVLPEAFLFSPKLGMMPKENAGEAQASRTAKFTYYMYRTKAAQRYNERERRACHYAMRRARASTCW